MTARQTILDNLRRRSIEPVDLPDRDGPWTTYDDPIGQFTEALSAAGGRVVRVSTVEAVDASLRKMETYDAAVEVCSLVPGVGRTDIDLAAVEDPHTLRTVDFAILPGSFGVAENGAVWIRGDIAPHRVLFFIAEHLAIVLPARRMVHHMHQAYQQSELNDRSFGLFLCGPSKTADIEQSLVIGAHGARSLTLFLVD
ncbi:MAG: lactate utilization protein C [Pirellulales bacterium]